MLRKTMGVFTAWLFLLSALPAARGGDDAAALSAWIDEQIQTRLDRDSVQRVETADDAEFLRRVYLDLHGVVPSVGQVRRFLDDSDPDKRRLLVDELLASPRFGEYQADLWRKRLISPLLNQQRFQPERFAGWLAERFNRGEGWDQTVRELVTATGKMDENPAVTYLIEGRDPLGVNDLTDLTSRYFLGIQLNCAQCHDHPFVEWTQQDYWGMAAFFAQIQTPGRSKLVHLRGLADDPQMTLASLAGADTLDGFLLRPPKFLGGQEVQQASPSEPLRQSLARWMTSPENPHFARAAVNRTWWHFFGRGIVNPVDDMHARNAPSHPELLEGLSRRFVESGFDLKFLCRAIVGSRTYQQTSRPGADLEREESLFARMPIKVLSAEQLYDSLTSLLGPPAKAPGINTRLGARHEFTQFFGTDGEEPIRYERGIPQLLRLMNSPQFAGRTLTSLADRIASESRSADEAAEELFLTILSRRPDDAERQLVREHVERAGGSLRQGCREVAWALLCSSEFSLNH